MIKINITDKKKIKRIKEINKKIKLQPLQIPDFSFMKNTLPEDCPIDDLVSGFPEISDLHLDIDD